MCQELSKVLGWELWGTKLSLQLMLWGVGVQSNTQRSHLLRFLAP